MNTGNNKWAIILITLLTAIIISGAVYCWQNKATTTEEAVATVQTFSDHERGISFDYPLGWKASTDEITGDIFVFGKPDGLMFKFPSQSFEEYETKHQEEIDEGYISIDPLELTFNNKTYQAKRYAQHGGVYYTFRVNGEHVGILSSGLLEETQFEEFAVIIDSLQF